MIITKKVDITISRGNINYYGDINNLKIGDKLSIDINNLPKSSRYKIDVKCQCCNTIKTLRYCDYNKYMVNKDKYTCKKCTLKNNNLKKYNVENVFQLDSTKEKIKKTVKNKYNVENVSQIDKVKKKKIETSLNNYGFEYPIQSNDIKDKIKTTNLKKYGVEWNLLSKQVIEKIKETNINRYGFNNPSKSNIIKERIKKSNILSSHKKIYTNNDNILNIVEDEYIIKCDCKKNHVFRINRVLYYKRKETKTILCTTCNPIDKQQSGLELQLINFIKENYNNTIIENDRKIINPYELDIYLPDLNLAFEFNGVYWHNELNKSNYYHYNKSKMCIDLNIKLIHIYEDDWIYKQDIVKSMILNKLNKTPNKIFARKCDIREISDISIVKEFTNKNHIQGYTTSTIKIGLFYNNKLVSIILFKKYNNDYELVRFCSKLYINVIGGASKLLKYFINNYNFNELKTFSDIGYSDGGVYEKIGFYFDKFINPSYYYVVDGIRIHKSNFKKEILIKKGYDSNKSEHQIMLERNIYRIYNSGYNRYFLKKD